MGNLIMKCPAFLSSSSSPLVAAAVLAACGCGGSETSPPAAASANTSSAGSAASATPSPAQSEGATTAGDAGAAQQARPGEDEITASHVVCTGHDIDLDAALIQRVCEIPTDKDAKYQDLKNLLQVKALASPTKASPGSHVDIILTYVNKGGRPLALDFMIDPVPRFLVEAYDAKGNKRVDLPRGEPPPPPKDATERLPSPQSTARVFIAPYGVAHVKVGWDALRTKWAPEKYKGTPIEMGYPRKPAGPLPQGKYQLRVATPLVHVMEGSEHELTAPKIDIEVGK
ncbi:MAG TPA: hypothetical protein VNO21_27395 [Polyangiaceae bacterium]|nr:hypothetical protein [Polyangiaceae bacterium]